MRNLQLTTAAFVQMNQFTKALHNKAYYMARIIAEKWQGLDVHSSSRSVSQYRRNVLETLYTAIRVFVFFIAFNQIQAL